MAASDAPHVAVVGAGITGITTAYNLVKRGAKVTIFDRHPYAAMETSFANGAQLSVCNAEVWNSWATVWKGVKWMTTPGAPLLVNPKPTWHKISWMLSFIGAIPRYEENTVTTVRLALEARARLAEIAAAENIDFDREDCGILHFYEKKHDFEAAAEASKLLAKGGLERRAVTPQEMKTLEPALKGTYYGGYFTPSDSTGDIHKFTLGLARACERLGVEMRLSDEVLSVTASENGVTVISQSTEPSLEKIAPPTEVHLFDRIVVCGGVMSRGLARMLGDRVNIYPVKGYSITIALPEASEPLAPWVSLLDESSKIVSARLGHSRLRIAGTAEFNGYNRDIRAERIDPLINWCRAHFPGISTRQSVPWTGLRPMMPNMLPRVGRGNNPRVFYNTGHGHLGWTLAAATADAIGALVMARGNVG
ncbi:MAG TPA: D-amino acid dehydrogenase [Roseiarcus sp.]|nr:D-amino acid dehydrogenase [Roseiarcus sp.]